jgi:predicted  nucleic acid-binding Zn-ribbon protein
VALQDTIRELEAREHTLHEQLADVTQSLRLARNQVARLEEMLQACFDEITEVKKQITEAKESLSHTM